MVTNVKMEVTPDLSRRVQEIVLTNGGCWFSGDSMVKNVEFKYLYIDQDNELTYGYAEKEFKEDVFEEISAYDFIASQGQQKWLPKFLEKCEFSDDKENWIRTFFHYYNPAHTYSYKTEITCYVYCRPISKPETITIDGKAIEISLESFEALKAQLCKG